MQKKEWEEGASDCELEGPIHRREEVGPQESERVPERLLPNLVTPTQVLDSL